MEVKLTSFVALPCSSFFCSVCVLCKFMSPGPFIWIWSSCSSFWSLQEAKDIINTLLLLGTREKAHPEGSNKWIYFGNQNAEASLGPDMLSALSLMHESSGSFPFVIKKKGQGAGRKSAGGRGKRRWQCWKGVYSFAKRFEVLCSADSADVRSSGLEINERCLVPWHFRAHAKVKISSDHRKAQVAHNRLHAHI